ncbi:MAG: ComEC/Rec2 family competence protein, partial [Coriobacteriia bacterium]
EPDSALTQRGIDLLRHDDIQSTQKDAAPNLGRFTIGQKLVDHIKTHYGTTHVDLVVSTHPDVDHINGLKTVLEQCSVGELLMHLPHLRRPRDASNLTNYEAIVELHDLAIAKGIPVTEPFTGVERFSGTIRILGPSELRYEVLLDTMISEAVSGAEKARFQAQGRGGLMVMASRVLERALASFPIETLGDDDDTNPRNQSSAITLLDVDDQRFLFTGDTGIESLDMAADYYEATVGSFQSQPLAFFQAPHHGSKHNLGKTILNRIFGEPGLAFGSPTAFISSAKASEKHPSPKVTNALGRRGAKVFVTEGNAICHGAWAGRAGWTPITPLAPLEEDDS